MGGYGRCFNVALGVTYYANSIMLLHHGYHGVPARRWSPLRTCPIGSRPAAASTSERARAVACATMCATNVNTPPLGGPGYTAYPPGTVPDMRWCGIAGHGGGFVSRCCAGGRHRGRAPSLMGSQGARAGRPQGAARDNSGPPGVKTHSGTSLTSVEEICITLATCAHRGGREESAPQGCRTGII